MTMCANHPEIPAAAYCRECGKPLCGECRKDALGVIYCAEHVPAAQATFSGTATARDDLRDSTRDAYGKPPVYGPSPYGSTERNTSPALALLLGTIPGVGAIYNGQYAKGLIHAVIFGLLISIISANDGSALAPLLGILIGVWWFYMVLEAYHTARKRREGLPVDEFSSLVNLRGSGERSLFSAVILIALGLLFLLNTTGLISMEQLARYWPVLLIVAGAWMLYSRIVQRTEAPPQEFSDERR
jgi:TM2 domain-containing membrane protein YozV